MAIGLRFIPEIPKSKLDASLQAEINASGGGNANITVATDLASITTAGANAIVEIRDNITLTANYQIPTGQTWQYTTGKVDVDTFELDLNGSSHLFSNKQIGLDLSAGTIIGSCNLLNEILYMSNIGGLDDDTFDNWSVIYNGLHIVNQSGSILRFNKQTSTAIYYVQVYDDAHASPFFTSGFGNDKTLVVGNKNYGDSYDNIEVSSESGVKIRSYAANELGSSVFNLYNTRNSKIVNNHFIGDRDTHLYDQEIAITVAATSAGDVRLRIVEHPNYQDDLTEKEINEVIPLTLSNLATNLQEIIDFVNIDAAFSDWTASAIDTNTIRLRGQAGQYSSVFFTDETSGATVNASAKLYEWGHCIVQDSRALDCEIGNNIIEGYHGDGVAKQEQGNGTNVLSFLSGSGVGGNDFTNGTIDENGTITDGDLGFWYLTEPRDLPSPHNFFQLMNQSNISVLLLNYKFWMVYYDDAATPVFIEKSPTLTPFDIYEYPSEFKKYRLVVEDYGTDMFSNVNAEKFSWFINSPSLPKGGLIHHNKFLNNRRHGVTNVLSDQIVEHNEFYKNSGVNPQMDLNIEDWSKRVQGQIVRYNTFSSTNKGSISVKGCNRVQIYGNNFIQGSQRLSSGDTSPAIVISFARNTQIHHNFYEYRSTIVDILTNSHDNHYTNSRLIMRSGSPMVHNEIFFNSTIEDGVPTGITTEGLGAEAGSSLENATFYINSDWGNRNFQDDANSIKYRNIKYYFNDRVSNHYAITDDSLRDVFWNNASLNKLSASRPTSPNGCHEGTYNGIYLYGAKVQSAMYHRVGWKQYASSTKDFYLESSLNIQNGYEKSFKIKDGEINGWFWLELGEFPTDGLGTYKTITIENVDVVVPPNIDATEGYLNNSKYGSGITLQKLLRITQDVNVNLVFKNCKFISEDTNTGLFMYLGNRGTTNFMDCTFDAPQAEVVDFTSTGTELISGVYAGANTGAITITRATTPGNRITFAGATVN